MTPTGPKLDFIGASEVRNKRRKCSLDFIKYYVQKQKWCKYLYDISIYRLQVLVNTCRSNHVKWELAIDEVVICCEVLCVGVI